jgi:hypothetical protein
MVEGKTNQEKTEKSVVIELPQVILNRELNELGYPLNDPYGLVAAFWNEEAPMTIFGEK